MGALAGAVGRRAAGLLRASGGGTAEAAETGGDSGSGGNGGGGGGGTLEALWQQTRGSSSSSSSSCSVVVVGGGAPAAEVADADAAYTEAVFRGAKLGVDLLGGASTGHLPVLGTSLRAEVAGGAGDGGGGEEEEDDDDDAAAEGGGGGGVRMQELEVGDQLVAVGGVSLVDEEDPFEKGEGDHRRALGEAPRGARSKRLPVALRLSRDAGPPC